MRSFDLINVLDLDLIAQAAALCSRLVVGVHSDEAVLRLTGRPPVMRFSDRYSIVSHVRGVDQVTAFEPNAVQPDPTVLVLVGAGQKLDYIQLSTTRRTESTVLQMMLESTDVSVA